MPDYSTRYEDRRLRLLRRLIPAGRGLALDVGCNDGTVTELLRQKGYDAVGVDTDPASVDRGHRQRPWLDLRVAAVGDVAYLRPRSLTTCLEVIEHLDERGQSDLLAAVARGADPGDLLMVSTPGRYSLYSLYERARGALESRRPYDWWDPTHVTVLSYRRLRCLLRASGFRVERTIGYHYLPERLRLPAAITRPPLNRAGFDLIVIARRVSGPAHA